jgi:hypothetical protein
VLAAGSALVVGLGLLAARHFATTSWPLANGDPVLLVAAGLLLLLAQALKAFGWGRLFPPDERPNALALAAGNDGAALIGVVLPGRFDDAMRVAVVRRYPGCPAGVRVLCLSLVMLGLIDSAALAPLAFVAALFPGAGVGMRAGLAVVAVAGVAAAAVILALPRLAGSGRALRFRLGRWLSARTTSRRAASQAWALVSTCWLVRGVAVFLLLGALGVGFSFPLALLFSAPVQRGRRCRSARRAQPRRWASAAPPSSPRVSGPLRRSPSPSPSGLSGSSPESRSFSSPLPGVPACRWRRLGPLLDSSGLLARGTCEAELADAVPRQPAEFLRRVRNWKIMLVTIPNSHPRIAVTRMIQTSDWRVEPSTQLTLTLPVLATTSAIRITSKATRALAHV